MVAGVVVNLATFNEIALSSCSKLTRMKVKMTLPLLCRIRETGSSWARGAELSYRI